MSEISAPASLLRPLDFPRKLLMGPGPSNAPPRVLAAGAMPLLGHLHPEFVQIMDECKAGMQYLFQTSNPVTLAVSGTGHAAMETACCNLVETGDVVLVLANGLWGHRFADMAGRHGGLVKQLVKSQGEIFTLDEVEQALKAHRPSTVFVTHGESSGTTLQPLEGLGTLCHKYNSLLLVDSVAAMGGVPFYMDRWEVDMVYTGGQKVLGVPPGASPISFSSRAMQKVSRRTSKVRSFYFDITELANYWGCDGKPRRYHHTAPINTIYALREGLALIVEEGLQNCWKRHQECAHLLHKGIRRLGLTLFVEDPMNRLPTVTGVVVPAGVAWKNVSDFAMSKYKVEISGGLGQSAGKVWRIGLMGYNAQPENVNKVLKALSEGLGSMKSKL